MSLVAATVLLFSCSTLVMSLPAGATSAAHSSWGYSAMTWMGEPFERASSAAEPAVEPTSMAPASSGDGAPRQQARLLQTDRAPRIQGPGRGSVDAHDAGGGRIEAADDTQERGFAAAARAQDRENLARLDIEIDIAQDRTDVVLACGERSAEKFQGYRRSLVRNAIPYGRVRADIRETPARRVCTGLRC